MKKVIGILIEAVIAVLVVYAISGLTEALYSSSSIIRWLTNTYWLYPIMSIGFGVICGMFMRDQFNEFYDRVRPTKTVDTKANWITAD